MNIVCLDCYGLIIIDFLQTTLKNPSHEVTIMESRLKSDLDSDSVQADLIESGCSGYKLGVFVRVLVKEIELFPLKVRKILITGGLILQILLPE